MEVTAQDIINDNNGLLADHDSTWFTPTDPLTEPIPKLRYVVHGYCARGLITVIGGSAGSGKSLLNQILFQKRNNELLETNPGTAIYLTGADSSESELRRRAKLIKDNHGLKTVELPDDMHCVATNELFMKELTNEIIKYDTDAIIFDTLADFHSGSTYEAELANNTMSEFRRLAKQAAVAVILITHTRKGSKIKNTYDVEDIADSRIFATKADFVFALKSEYKKDKTNLIELQCLKSRSAQPIAPLRAEIYLNAYSDELNISRTDKLFAGEIESQNHKREIEEKIEKVKILKEQGRTHSQIAEEVGIAKGSVSKYLKS